MSEMRKM